MPEPTSQPTVPADLDATVRVDMRALLPPGLEQPGDMIGRYRLIEPLGEGGFGVVWRAEQNEPIRREVALKVIKAGRDSREIIARFEAERQTLALMDHPNIAGVLDAGTTDNGRPFFVMELVKGMPVSEYCDTRKLTIRQRLELFIPVCRAVHHAHQKAVLHRDLKPSNILVMEVDGRPLPKVIDFGIAKALGTTVESALQVDMLQTQAGVVIGTPQYMSPEQAGATRDLDTRSDIFTLGVILFELLTGDTPLTRESLRKAALDEVLRLVREVEPRKPSSRVIQVTDEVQSASSLRLTEPVRLRRTLRGDLDWITLRALEKERERRYGSAAALAQDLERYLANEPVEAGPPSAIYRFRKLVRRNRLAVGAAAVIVLLLVAGIAASTWQAVRATRAEEQISLEKARQDDLLWSASRGDHEAAIRAFDEGHHARGLAHLERALEYRPANAGALVASAFHAFGINAPLWQPRLVRCYRQARWIEGVVFSPDGRRLALSCWRTLNVIDPSTGQDVFLKDHIVSHAGMSFSPDSRLLVAAGYAENDTSVEVIRALEAGSGTEVWRHPFGSRLKSVVISPDGQHVVASLQDKSLQVLALKTGALLHKIENRAAIAAVCFDTRTGRLIYALGDGEVRAMDLATGGLTPVVRLGSGITSMAAAPDGRFLAVGCHDESLALVDLSTLAVSHRISFEDGSPKRESLSYPCFSPDGTIVAFAKGRSAILVNVDSGAKMGEVDFAYGPSALSFSPDACHLAIACWDNQVVMIDVRSQKEVFKAELGLSPMAVSFSPDGSCLAVGTQEGFATLYQPVVSPEWLSPRDKNWARVASVNAGRQRASVASGKTLQVIDPATGRQLSVVDTGSAVHSSHSGWGRYAAAHAFSEDGRLLLAACSANAIGVFDADSGQKLREIAFDAPVREVCVQPNAKGYAAACADKTIHWGDVATGQMAGQTTLPYVANCLAHSPDGRYLAVGSRDTTTAYLVEMGSGSIRSYRCYGGVTALAFSPDGNRLAIGCIDDPVHVVDPVTMREVIQVEHGLNLTVSSLAFSADGRCLLVGGSDKAARLFDAAHGKELARMEFNTDVAWVGFTGGERFAALGKDGTDRKVESSWFDTHDVLSPAWRAALRLQSGFRFHHDGRLVPLSLEERTAAQEEVTRFVSQPAFPSERWQHALLKWSHFLPQERTLSPWSSTPAHAVAAHGLMQAAAEDHQTIRSLAAQIPWHPLGPVSSARLEVSAGTAQQSTRTLFLARLTLERLRQADERILGREALAEYAAWASKVIYEELKLPLEARQALVFAIERTSEEKRQALLELQQQINR